MNICSNNDIFFLYIFTSNYVWHFMRKKGFKKFNLTAINFILTSEQFKRGNEQWLTANWISKLLDGLRLIGCARCCIYTLYIVHKHSSLSCSLLKYILTMGHVLLHQMFSELIEMSVKSSMSRFLKLTRIHISHSNKDDGGKKMVEICSLIWNISHSVGFCEW